MKRVTFYCDFCGKELIASSDKIELGCKNEGGLFYSNPSASGSGTGGKITLENYSDLHFCGKAHFIEYFFGKD